jgi:all-trans-8'-apo-beta-carotenal 15,15'-oxygenase
MTALDLPIAEKPTEDYLPYDIKDWQGGYRSQTEEYRYEIDEIDGTIPPELRGTLYRNGPALFERGGASVRHPFDGDGAIAALKIAGGKAFFQNRFVRTQGYQEEERAGKFVYRGVFGTQKPGGFWTNAFDVRLKNIANTHVIYWGKKLLALWEAAEPYRLDPQNLETIGIDYLQGVLQPGDGFAAHPRFDPAGKMVNFALQPGLSTKLRIFEFDREFNLVSERFQKLSGFAFIHDFAITENYYIFFQNPVSFNPLPFLFGQMGAGECVKFNPEKPTKIIIVPRHTKDESQTIVVETTAGFVFHHANAYETDGRVVIDSICYAELSSIDPELDFRKPDFNQLSPGELWRFDIDSNNRTVSKELVLSQCCEFPTVHPNYQGKNHRYAYMGVGATTTGNSPLQGICKLDLITREKLIWQDSPTTFIGEPHFIPHPQGDREDDGWIVTLLYDASIDRSRYAILNANDLTPVAILHLKHHIPYGLHGMWTQED